VSVVVPGFAASTIRGMALSAKRLAACAVVLAVALAGCAAPRLAGTAAPDVPLASPSAWRSGVVDQAIRETEERRFIRDLWRAKRDAR